MENDSMDILIMQVSSVIEWGTTIKYKFDKMGMCYFCISMIQFVPGM